MMLASFFGLNFEQKGSGEYYCNKCVSASGWEKLSHAEGCTMILTSASASTINKHFFLHVVTNTYAVCAKA